MAAFKYQKWAHYQTQPAFILGFHGCDRNVGEKVLHEHIHLKASENSYDWLGHGIYFWEGNPARALQFATECMAGNGKSKGSIKEPFVLGAIINLGHCLNLADIVAIEEIKASYAGLIDMMQISDLPQNGTDLRTRDLDCLVFNSLHRFREEANADSDINLPPYDTVRGLFWEGDLIYENAGIREKNHIQICVRNTKNILGYFHPLISASN